MWTFTRTGNAITCTHTHRLMQIWNHYAVMCRQVRESLAQGRRWLPKDTRLLDLEIMMRKPGSIHDENATRHLITKHAATSSSGIARGLVGKLDHIWHVYHRLLEVNSQYEALIIRLLARGDKWPRDGVRNGQSEAEKIGHECEQEIEQHQATGDEQAARECSTRELTLAE